jgi:hypothetical protein
LPVFVVSASENRSASFCTVTFQEFINEWDEQERIAQEKAEQESSLYRYRRSSRTALSEEEEEEEWEFRKRFPLHEKVVWGWEDLLGKNSLMPSTYIPSV